MDVILGSDDEFHETFEDITSTSSSESADEGSVRDLRARTSRVAPATGYDRPPIWASSSFYSKFSVWKDDRSSINERRERFFKQMGIKSLRDEPHVGHATSLLGRSSIAASDENDVKYVATHANPAKAANCAEENDVPACQLCGGNLKAGIRRDSAHLEGVRNDGNLRAEGERRDIGFYSEDGYKSNSILGGTGLTSTTVSDEVRLREQSGAVLREGRINSGSTFILRPSKVFECCCSVDGSGGGSIESPQSVKDQEFTSKPIAGPEGCLSPLLDSCSLKASGYKHQASSSQEKLSQSYDTDGYETSSQDGHSAIDESIMEDRLKIRDLDSGKEFVINRVNRDGSLNMLREVATGRELTLAEFEKTLGLSPITQELRRRQRALVSNEKPGLELTTKSTASRMKKKSWLKNLKGALSVRSSKEKLFSGGSVRSDKVYQSADDTDGSSKGGLSHNGSSRRGNSMEGSLAGDSPQSSCRSGPQADDNTGFTWRQPQKVKVKLRQKSIKELSELHIGQEIQAHQGAIWTMKFSPDGRYLASAGQDRVVHVWEVLNHPSVAEPDLWGGPENGTRESRQLEGSFKAHRTDSLNAGQGRSTKSKRDGSTKGGKGAVQKQKASTPRRKGPVPKLFWLSEKPMRSFRGHTEDILDLSWSQTQFCQFLLSSSMDKTVRLWHMSYEECLRVFSHNDYVTCVEFNPIDDRYFLSGSLDDKVRIWSIPEHHVVSWSDLREMVTAVCYTPDGKKAIVGSYKGTCRFYNTTGNILQLDAQIDVRSENKKARGKKITGLHCMPGESQKVLVTSNDSYVRVYDGLDLSAKYKGLRNVNSQISASYTLNGDYIISASEDSRVFVWSSSNRDVSSTKPLYRRDKQQSCEEFPSGQVSVAIPWPEPSTCPNFSHQESVSPGSVRSDGFGSAYAISDPELSPPREAVSVTGAKLSENSKCPSSCLGRSPLGIFGSGRKNSVAVADEPTETKQVEGGNQLDGSPINVSPEASVPSPLLGKCDDSPPHLQRCPSFFPDSGPKGSATWPEEKLSFFGSRLSSGPTLMQLSSVNSDISGRIGLEANPVSTDAPATISATWGLVIVTAGLGGQITTFQNYALPVRL